MTKIGAGVFVALLVFAAAAEATSLRVYREGEAPMPRGDRINVKEDLIEIHASQPTYVAHGNGRILFEPTLQMTDEELHDLLTRCSFELTLDGTKVVPDYTRAGTWASDGLSLWYVETCYEFGEGYFSPGIHVLEGRWITEGFPCQYDMGGCEEDASDAPTGIGPFTIESSTFENGLIFGVLSHVLTLVVLP